jgi:type II protein arginine methyltransferase
MTSASTFETLVGHVANKPVPLVRLGQLLLAKGRSEQARELCAKAVAMAPDNEEVRAVAAEVFSRDVGGWYFRMVCDRVRNIAYEMAMRRAIRPGCRVLDIGTGTGFLAMMAARAGAAEVVTCESNPTVAAVASEIIARNGFADRVLVISKSSIDLEVGVDLSDRADVLVWDVSGSNMIGAGALPTVEQAVRRLVRPGAPAIPAHGTIRVALSEDRKAHLRRMHIVEGFDLSPFNRLAAPQYTISIGDEQLKLCSEPGDLFHFDFQSGGPFPEARALLSLSAFGGLVNGIAQWLHFDLDDHGTYENAPSEGAFSAFAVVFHPLRRPIEMAPGAKLTVVGAHDRQSIRIWAQAPQMG